MYKTAVKCLLVLLAFEFALELSNINTSGLFVGSMVPFLLATLYVMLLKSDKGVRRCVKDKVGIDLISLVFALFYVLSHVEDLFKYDAQIICLVALVVTFSGLFLFINLFIGKIVSFVQSDSIVISEKTNKYRPRYILGVACVILLLTWGITYVTLYPGIFGVDSLENLEQAIGKGKMNVLFPFYMTLYLRFCWNIGITIFGNGNSGIGIYCLTQMIVMALVVSYLIYRIYKCNVKTSICALVLLYFILIPYHAQSSIMVFKDTPYAIGTLLFMQLMWEYYVFGEPAGRCKRILKLMFLVLGGILMTLSRANGFAAFLFCLPFVLIVFYRKQKRIAGYILLTFVAIMLVRGPIFDFVISRNNLVVTGSENPVYDVRYQGPTVVEECQDDNRIEKQLAVSNASVSYESTGIYIITAQQLGRVVVDRELSQEEYDTLSTVINVDEMKVEYNKFITTGAMSQIVSGDIKQYLSVWLEFGLKYPYTYFIAWKDQTSGYWDPVLCSGGHDLTFWDMNSEVYQDSIMPESIVGLYYKINDMLMARIPTLSLFWCNGFVLWITFFAITLVAIKRNYSTMVFYTPLIGLWLTLLIANPCNGSFRYFYSFYLCLPLSLIIPFVRGQYEKLEE